MHRKHPSIYRKIKASVLLLCLGLVILGTCPIKKILLGVSSIKIESSTQSSIFTEKNNLICSYSDEMVKAPLVELTKKSNNNAFYLILSSALVSLFTFFVRNESIPSVKRRLSLVSPVPLFLRNQVFIL